MNESGFPGFEESRRAGGWPTASRVVAESQRSIRASLDQARPRTSQGLGAITSGARQPNVRLVGNDLDVARVTAAVQRNDSGR